MVGIFLSPAHLASSAFSLRNHGWSLGFNVPTTIVIQLIGGYLHPGKPVANMYFVLFAANAQAQALSLLENLKPGQYGKLSPKCTFTVQIMGTVFGVIINYILMSSITTNQREVLLSIEGTNIWSGQVTQSFNSNAIAFGALSEYMFSLGATYQSIPLALLSGFFVPIPFYLLHRRSRPWDSTVLSLPSSAGVWAISPLASNPLS